MLLGLDVGGTKCAVIIGQRSQDGLRIIDKVAYPTPSGPDAALVAFEQQAKVLLHKHGNPSIEAVGISCGGPLSSKRGFVLSPPNLPGWTCVPVVDWARKAFGAPAHLQNDANACAIAEWKLGAGRGTNDMIFLTFGTGMGAGLIIGGRLHAGVTDSAGEIGHVRMADQGPVGYGKRGSFEGFCSGGGIAQLGRTYAMEMMQMSLKPGFLTGQLSEITAKSIAEAAFRGDVHAQNVFRQCGEMLGRGLAILVDVLNPECIVLGSIFQRAEKLLRPAMQEALAREALTDAAAAVSIRPAALGDEIGDYAALCIAAYSPF